MPILYLELLENKAKIKPELVNKAYEPPGASSPANSSANSPSDEGPTLEFADSPRSSPDRSGSRSIENYKSEDNDSNDESGRMSSPEESGASEFSDRMSEDLKSEGNKSTTRLSNRMKELLDSSDEESGPRPTTSNDRKGQYNAPSLKALEESGKFIRKREIEDIGHTSLSEQEKDDAKRELLFKFELLKKSYKTDNIPEFSIHSDYDQMKKSYEMTLRTLSLDKSVEDYKRYLMGGFMLMEFVCGNWFGFDMSGFTQQQMVSMSSYEKLLIELGEKSYVPTGSKWPVEVRLLFLVIMNAAFFIISKMILKKTGSNLMNAMNGLSSNASGNQQQSGIKKRKMKGPTVSLDDIPDIDDQQSTTS